MKRQKPEVVRVGGTTVRIYTVTPTNGLPYRQIADYSSGRRRLRSFTDPVKAKQEAGRIARLTAAGEAGAAQLRGSDAASYSRAVELLRPTGTAIEVACAHFAEAFKILGSDKVVEAAKFFASRCPANLVRKPVADTVGEFMELKKSRGNAEQYLRDLRSRLGRFMEKFKTDIGSVTTADLQRWFDGLKLSARSIKNYRTVLGTLFSFAEQRGYIARGTNPIEGTEKILVRNVDAIEIYTAAEVAKLLKAAPAKFRPCIALGAFGGLRSAEIQRLSWEDIDFESEHITVAAAKAKTASRRIIPLLPVLRAWLELRRKKSGLIWNGNGGFGLCPKQTGATAGVPWKANALRHSFISYRLNIVQNVNQIALEAGNSAAVIFKHYRELTKPREAQAWFDVKPN